MAMSGAIILKEVGAMPAVSRVDPAAPAPSRWASGIGQTLAARVQRNETRARCAWLLAIEVAEAAVAGTHFARIYSTPGKVGRGSDAKTALARKLACYLTSTIGDCDVAAVARASRLNRKTVHLHLREVEDLRDDPALDQHLEDMGRQMIGAAASLVLASMGNANMGEAA